MNYKDLVAADGFELGTSRTITPEGFLEAPATIARTGVQLYRAGELGLDKYGIPGDQIVRLHRPTEELFSPSTLSSFQNKPVINGTHKTVTADNWKDLAVGDYAEPFANGRTLDVKKLTVRDKSAVDDVLQGKKYLSIGYKFDIDMTPGVTGDGQSYDGVQRNIVGNHVLITNSPRGGPVCHIADTATVPATQEKKMRNMIINGVPVSVGDSEASIIESLQRDLEAARNQKPTVTIAGKSLVGADAIVEAFAAAETAHTTAITELKSKVVGDEQIEQLVQARVAVIGDATRMVKDFDAKGKNTKQIHQEVLTSVTNGDEGSKNIVTAILGDKTIGDASEEQLATAFRAISANFKVAGANGADSAVAEALTGNAGAVTTGDSTQPRVMRGAAAFHSNSANFWRGKQK